MTQPVQIVVCDAGSLIHLDEVACLDLLADFPRVLVPETVWREVERHRPQALYQQEVILERFSTTEEAMSADLHQLARALNLDPGERAALVVVQKYPQALFVTDDAAARLAAQSLSYRVHGTIGILLRAIRRGQRSQSDIVATLESLPTQSTLHIAFTLLQEVIHAANTYQPPDM